MSPHCTFNISLWRRLRIALGTLNQSGTEDRRMIKSSWFYVKFKYNEKVSPNVDSFFPGIAHENVELFSCAKILFPDILYLLSVAVLNS